MKKQLLQEKVGLVMESREVKHQYFQLMNVAHKKCG